MATKKTTEVATVKPGGAVALPYDYGDDAGVGMDITMEDLRIPFIALAQNDSKILDPDEPTYAEGGAAGMMFNGATKEYSDELYLALAIRQTTFVEWKEDRGGFVAEHMPLDPIVREAKANAVKKHELRTKDGNDLEETRSIYAIILDADANPLGYCVVPFTSSKMGPWRDYWTKMDTARVAKGAPLYAHTVRLTAVDDKSRAGKKFKNYLLAPANGGIAESMVAPDSAAFIAAKALFEAVNDGRATADRSTAGGETGNGKGDEEEVF